MTLKQKNDLNWMIKRSWHHFQQQTNPPHPATIFQNSVFNGCTLAPYAIPQKQFPDSTNPVAEHAG